MFSLSLPVLINKLLRAIYVSYIWKYADKANLGKTNVDPVDPEVQSIKYQKMYAIICKLDEGDGIS